MIRFFDAADTPLRLHAAYAIELSIFITLISLRC